MIACPMCFDTVVLKWIGKFRICNTCALGFTEANAKLPALADFRRPDGLYYFPNWNSLGARLLGRLPRLRDDQYLFACHTVSMLASRQGMRARAVRSSLPMLPGFAAWGRGAVIRADIAPRAAPPAGGVVPHLTLGMIAARDAWPDALALCADMADCAAEMIVVVDTADRSEAATLTRELQAHLAAVDPSRLQVIAHPLNADFAAQRNRVQDAARTPWVLHLDCDERLAPAARRALSGLIAGAEEDGNPLIAFTRRNFVDGQLSAFYPDLQYRLLRRELRFTRAVHEYPVLPHGQRPFVHLGSGILHQLTGAHVERRARRYEAIQSGGGRPGDTYLLLQPFENPAGLPDQ